MRIWLNFIGCCLIACLCVGILLTLHSEIPDEQAARLTLYESTASSLSWVVYVAFLLSVILMISLSIGGRNAPRGTLQRAEDQNRSNGTEVVSEKLPGESE